MSPFKKSNTVFMGRKTVNIGRSNINILPVVIETDSFKTDVIPIIEEDDVSENTRTYLENEKALAKRLMEEKPPGLQGLSYVI